LQMPIQSWNGLSKLAARYNRPRTVSRAEGTTSESHFTQVIYLNRPNGGLGQMINGIHKSVGKLANRVT
jgi:hypothetical protein